MYNLLRNERMNAACLSCGIHHFRGCVYDLSLYVQQIDAIQ